MKPLIWVAGLAAVLVLGWSLAGYLQSKFERVSLEQESLRDAVEILTTRLDDERPPQRVWQDVTQSRVLKVTNEDAEPYSSDHDIEIAVTTRRMNAPIACSIHLLVDGRRIQTDRGVPAGEPNKTRWCYATINATIPANTKYQIQAAEKQKLLRWSELRKAQPVSGSD